MGVRMSTSFDNELGGDVQALPHLTPSGILESITLGHALYVYKLQ